MSKQPVQRPRRITVPIVLMLLALTDLWVEFQLLLDHPTLTTAFHAVINHPLAWTVLLLSPSLLRRYR